MNLLLVFLVASLTFSFAVTYFTIRIAKRVNMVNIPNERSLHSIPTPRGGGIAIVLTWYIGITFLYFWDYIETNLFLALISGVILAIVSFIDDLIEIKPIIRLIIQFITAITAFYFLGALRPLLIPSIEINYPLLIYPFAIVGLVWFINLFNFMDGVDGFASIEAIIISLVLFFYSRDIITLLLVVSVLGFLYWNWPKAKIFMGDVGSTQLGFILVILGIHYHNTLDFSILNWIMLASPFWFDASFTLFRRFRNKEKLSQAHKKHAYQRLVQSGFSHFHVDLLLILLNVFIIGMIVVYREVKVLQIPVYFISILLLYVITKFIDKRVPFLEN